MKQDGWKRNWFEPEMTAFLEFIFNFFKPRKRGAINWRQAKKYLVDDSLMNKEDCNRLARLERKLKSNFYMKLKKVTKSGKARRRHLDR